MRKIDFTLRLKWHGPEKTNVLDFSSYIPIHSENMHIVWTCGYHALRVVGLVVVVFFFLNVYNFVFRLRKRPSWRSSCRAGVK